MRACWRASAWCVAVALVECHLYAQQPNLQAGADQISGFILNESVNAAPVTYTRASATDKSNGAAISQKDGAFFPSGLPAGGYRTFEQVNGSNLRNLAKRSSRPPTVTIGPCQLLSAVIIVVQAGARINVRLDDENRLLSRPGKANNANAVIVAGWGERGFHDVPLASQDVARQNHILVVPYSHPLKVKVYNQSLRVLDNASKAIAAIDAPGAFEVQKGYPPTLIHLKIAGS
jgi:hypothetical protein